MTLMYHAHTGLHLQPWQSCSQSVSSLPSGLTMLWVHRCIFPVPSNTPLFPEPPEVAEKTPCLSNRFCSSRKHAQWHHVHHHPNVCLPRQPMATATGNREHTISATSLSWPDTDWRKRCWWQRRLRYHHSPPGPIQEDLRNSYPCHRKDHNNKYNDNI